MKILNLTSIALLFSGVVLIACDKETTDSNTAENLKAEKALARISRTNQIELIIDFSTFKFELEKESGLMNIRDIEVFRNEFGLYILQYKGTRKDGNVVIFGEVLALSQNPSYLNRTGKSCKQSCTSENYCSGCDLRINSECSGSCWCNSGSGNCVHKVESGDGSVGSN